MKMGMTAARRFALAIVLACLGVAASSGARADMFLKGTTSMLYGSTSDTISFNTPGAGTVTAQIASLPWPVPLSALSFSATTATNTLASWSTNTAMNSPQVETFQVDGAGTYFAHITATAGPSPLDLGLYSLMFTFTPSAVPLPAAAGLLLLGCLVLVALRGTLRGPRNESVMYPA